MRWHRWATAKSSSNPVVTMAVFGCAMTGSTGAACSSSSRSFGPSLCLRYYCHQQLRSEVVCASWSLSGRTKPTIWSLPQQLTKTRNQLTLQAAKTIYRPIILRVRLVKAATTGEVEAEKQLIEEDAMERMEKSFESVKLNFNTVRTGRASPALLDRVEVDYYGSAVNLKSIAQVSTPDGSTLLVQPFEKTSLSAIEKAISKSDLGLTPNNDGSVIRLIIPQLTADRRKELLKLVARLAEEGKVAIRNVRRDAIKAYEKLEKEKKLSTDNVKDLSGEIQKFTDDYVKKVDLLFKQKEKELTNV